MLKFLKKNAGVLVVLTFVTLILTLPRLSKNLDKEIDVPTTTLQPSKDGNQLELKKKVKVIEVTPLNTIILFDRIDTLSMNKALSELKNLNEFNDDNSPIYIVIDSPGGSILDGARLISAMEVSRRPVNTVCYSICASMGAMIHSYGKTRMLFDRSILMYHNAASGTMGELPNMLSQLRLLERYVQRMEQNVAKRSLLSLDEYRRLADRELWIDAEDALVQKLTDQIVYLSGLEHFISGTSEAMSNTRKSIQFDLKDNLKGNVKYNEVKKELAH